MDKISDDLLREIAELDWAVETNNPTPERQEAVEKRNSLVATLKLHWEVQEEVKKNLRAA